MNRRLACLIAVGLGSLALVGCQPTAFEPEPAPDIAADIPAPPRTDLDVPYVATPMEVVDEMLRVANVGPDDLLYDLGSGDGRIVIAAAEQFGTRGIGIDIDPERIEEANANAEAAGVTELVEFREQDIFDADFSDATVVTLYLLSSINLRLKPRLLQELEPGTRVVSHAFSMGDWEPEAVIDVDGRTVYFWTIPEEVPPELL
ncbi:class I SAM-dependent methyltransferase [Nodosilinea sp. P-1105]|uniref:SAM-dependent methyltransferase n=1 Tax=Nodosilinea sp. P-1105 TaxID=2546229 RepID=UPI00146A0BC4|nr:class I SAM-dependent methyltransferase [Nodosilinea sp. P-1105]NMF85276.1 class I SAM-dependent methyltransferase [Nodosilinea sp. P-1105]